jgi:hypothetical protein
MKKICVFCACREGNDPAFREAAQSLGSHLVNRNIDLVYGGSNCGLMGVLAESVLSAGGKVTAVMPKNLKIRAGHKKGTELILVNSMHERKQKMFDLSDAFIALPGGFGTLDEISEQLVWSQLGYSRKPCGFLNINGYYDHLLNFLNHATDEGLVSRHHRVLAYATPDIEELLDKFKIFQPELCTKV